MTHEVTKTELIKNYREYFEKFGDSPAGVQYGSGEGQIQRFSQLIRIDDLSGCHVLDVGCGLGHLYPFLQERYGAIDYTGVDIVPETVAHAAARFPKAHFLCQDIMSSPLARTFDYVLMNGLFNNSVAGYDAYMHDLLRAGFAHTTRGLSFNFTSSYVTSRDETMAYHDPAEVLTFCLNELSTRVSMHHHYARRDVSVFVYKDTP